MDQTHHGTPASASSPRGTAMVSHAKGGPGLYLLFGGITTFMLVMMFIANDSTATWIMLPTVLLTALAGWLFCSGKVVADEAGVRVYGGGIWKMLNTPAADIASAETTDINPLDYGGWGLRISGAGTGFITGKGRGIIVKRTKGAPRILSMGSTADAEMMAAHLNDLVRRNAGTR